MSRKIIGATVGTTMNPQKVGGSGTQTQPDWNQTDTTKTDYIKNKPNVITEEVFTEEINKRPIAYDIRSNKEVGFSFYPEDLDVVGEDGGLMLLYGSNIIMTKEEFEAGSLIVNSSAAGGEGWTQSFAGSVRNWNGVGYLAMNSVLLVLNGNEDTPNGLYFIGSKETIQTYYGTLVTLYFPSVAMGELKTIDEKFLPEPLAYDTRKIAPLTIEFDGQLEGKEYVDLLPGLNSFYFVKISDMVPTFEELDAAIVYGREGEEVPLTGSVTKDDETGALIAGAIIATPTILDLSKIDPDVTGILTSGLWTMIMSGSSISKIYFPSCRVGELKTIDEKFLPEPLAYDTRKTRSLAIEWDGTIGDRFVTNDIYGGAMAVKVSDNTPTIAELEAGTISYYFEGELYTEQLAGQVDDLSASGVSICDFGGYGFVLFNDVEFEGLLFKAGTYFSAYSDEFYSCKLYLPSYTTGELKTIDKKYFPDTVVQAWKPIETLKNINCNFEFGANGYVTEESFDRFLEDKEYYKNYDCGMWYIIKLSDECIPEEELSKVTSFNKYIADENSLVENTDAVFIDSNQTLGYLYGAVAALENINPSDPMHCLTALLGHPSIIIITPAFGQISTAWTPGTYLHLLVTRRLEDEWGENTEIPEGYCQIQGPIDLSFPHTIDPGQKINPELIDGEIPYKRQTTGLTVEYDGTLDGKEYITVDADDGVYLVKISDVVPTLAELEAGGIVVCSMGQTIAGNIAGYVEIEEDTGLMVVGEYLFVTPQSIMFSPSLTITPGIWTMYYAGYLYTSKLTLPTVTHTSWKKLDADLIDAAWMATTSEARVNVLPEQTFEEDYNVVNEMIFPEAPLKAIVTFDGVEYICPILSYGTVDSPVYAFGDANGENYPFYVATLVYPKVVIKTYDENSHTIQIDVTYTLYNKMPEEFLPESLNAGAKTFTELTAATIMEMATLLRQGRMVCFKITDRNTINVLHIDTSDSYDGFYYGIGIDYEGSIWQFSKGWITGGRWDTTAEGVIHLLSGYRWYKLFDRWTKDGKERLWDGLSDIYTGNFMAHMYGGRVAPASFSDFDIPHKELFKDEVFHDSTARFEYDTSNLYYTYSFTTVNTGLTENEKYTVIFNGSIYPLVAFKKADSELVYLGAPDEPDNRIPFIITSQPYGNFYECNLRTKTDYSYNNDRMFAIYREQIVPLASEEYLPEETRRTMARKSDIPEQVQADWNQTDVDKPDYIKNKPEDYLMLRDKSTSYRYYLSIIDGQLIYVCACTSIYVKDLSEFTFIEGDPLDLERCVVAICEDGSERFIDDCGYPAVVPSIDNPTITITYTEGGKQFTTNATLNVTTRGDNNE